MRKVLASVLCAVALGSCSSVRKESTSPLPHASAQATDSATPHGPAPDSVEYFNVVVGNTVHFNFDAYDLNSEDRETLRKQAHWLNQYPVRTMVIEGHCDERGTREYDLGLGERRADAVRQYLVSLGVHPNRLKTISFGKEHPLCVASEESCWSKNRRGVSVIQ